ncbi:MAG: segregation/condensation protein A [bacterium]|nr:segregation/condensation protein A [bacterium]
MNNYRIEIDHFEGPLDLLLHLIRKNDLDIYDIPISFILDEYLKYITAAQELNVDVAGEFIFMASELAYIKSKMLLPPEPSEEEEEGPDPRADLIQRLLTYQRFKAAAGWLGQRPLWNRDIFDRPHEPITLEGIEPEEGMEEELEVDMTTLLAVYHKVWSRLPKGHTHEVRVERHSVAARMLELVERLKTEKSLDWLGFFQETKTRYDLVVTFLALLEMTRLKMIRLSQHDRYGTIVVHSQLMEA